MAKLSTGINGPVTGKVGNNVGGIWKGINYVRGNFIPANPQTAAQTAQRDKLAEIVRLSKPILGGLLRDYYKSIVSGLSTTEWSEHIKRNLLTMTSKTDYENYGLKDNGNYWYSDMEASDSSGNISISWAVEDSTFNASLPWHVIIQPDLQIPAKLVKSGNTLEDEGDSIPSTSYDTTKDMYLVTLFYDATTDTFACAFNHGKVHTGA